MNETSGLCKRAGYLGGASRSMPRCSTPGINSSLSFRRRRSRRRFLPRGVGEDSLRMMRVINRGAVLYANVIRDEANSYIYKLNTLSRPHGLILARVNGKYKVRATYSEANELSFDGILFCFCI